MRRKSKKKPNYEDSRKNQLAFLNACKVDALDLISEYFYDAHNEINCIDTEGKSALHLAVVHKRISVIKLLISQDKLNIDQFDQIFTTPLYQAVKTNSIDIVELLCQNKANPNIKCLNLGWTPVHCSAKYGLKEILLTLVRHSGNIHEKDNLGLNTLFHAAICGQKHLIDMLLDLGIEINETDDNGKTALFWAIFYHKTSTAKLLIEKGINIHIKDNCGNDALFHARLRQLKDLTKLMIEMD